MMKEKVAIISVFVNLVLAASKILIGIVVNSAAILSEGLHSSMDTLSSSIGLFGIIKAKKPSDKEHPYGHYKFEIFAGLIITLILFGTGVGIIYESYKGFLNPGKVEITHIALGIMIFSALINEIMSKIKIHFGKKENSMSLLSDGFHSRVDVYTSVAVLFGLILNKYWIYADPLLALLIGVYIIKQSFSLGKNATDSLLDVSAGEMIENKIKEMAKEQRIDVSDLKTQKRGSAITANLIIDLPNKLNVEEATKLSNSLREKLIENIENLMYVAIQIKSHDVSTGFYKPSMGFGRSFEWQRRGKFKEEIREAKGLGPSGYCVCPKCGYELKHERGTPCTSLKCPKCNTLLIRK